MMGAEVTSVIGWKAWYQDGAMYSSRHTSWADLPDDGVVLVLLYFDATTEQGESLRRYMEGDNWYFMAPGPDGPIYGHNSHDREENQRRYPGLIAKRGQWTDERSLREIQQSAAAARNP